MPSSRPLLSTTTVFLLVNCLSLFATAAPVDWQSERQEVSRMPGTNIPLPGEIQQTILPMAGPTSNESGFWPNYVALGVSWFEQALSSTKSRDMHVLPPKRRSSHRRYRRAHP